MSHFTVGCKQIWGGLKTMFGYSAKRGAQSGAQKVAQSGAQKVAQKAGFSAPLFSEQVARQPLALPAPTAAQLAKDVPMVCVPKVLNGLNLSELRMSQEILKDGTHVRYFRAPGSNKILIKMEDKGIVHKEWIYGKNGGPDDFTFVKSVGNGDRYVCVKKGNHVQVEQQAIKYKDGIEQKVSKNDAYYNDHCGTGYHVSEIKGFDGKTSGVATIRGEYTHTVSDLKGGFQDVVTPYRWSSVDDLTRDMQGNVLGRSDELYRQVSKAKESYFDWSHGLIKDFDEALFNPYKA